jgi:hypothetical protein
MLRLLEHEMFADRLLRKGSAAIVRAEASFSS